MGSDYFIFLAAKKEKTNLGTGDLKGSHWIKEIPTGEELLNIS
jgi:hypothetical protein